MTAQIIFIHGASSSGKTTLARRLQATLPLPFWHISIDHLRDAGVLPQARFKSGEFDWRTAKPAFFDGFHRSLAAYASAGNNLIVEHILDQPEWYAQLRSLLQPYGVLFVGLHCPLDVLEARETARGDRPKGSAAQDFAQIHKGLTYDLDLQSLDGPEANAARILTAWKAAKPGVFDQA